MDGASDEPVSVGDRMVVGALGDPAGDILIVEVLSCGGERRYRVRWRETGHESIISPGPVHWFDHVAGACRLIPPPRRCDPERPLSPDR
jgi:hypothetical protein